MSTKKSSTVSVSPIISSESSMTANDGSRFNWYYDAMPQLAGRGRKITIPTFGKTLQPELALGAYFLGLTAQDMTNLRNMHAAVKAGGQTREWTTNAVAKLDDFVDTVFGITRGTGNDTSLNDGFKAFYAEWRETPAASEPGIRRSTGEAYEHGVREHIEAQWAKGTGAATAVGVGFQSPVLKGIMTGVDVPVRTGSRGRISAAREERALKAGQAAAAEGQDPVKAALAALGLTRSK